MLFTKFIRGMAAGALALAALGAHAHTVQNTPLEKIPLQSAVCTFAQEAQVLDAPEENAFIYGDCVSGTTINPNKFIDPDGRHPILWAVFEAVAWLGARQAGTVLVVEGAAAIATGTMAPSVALEGAAASVAAKTGILANKAAGEAFQAKVASQVKAAGQEIAEEITIKTASSAKTRMDIVSRDANGVITCTECKASATAPLTKGQTVAHPEIATSGGVVVGQGKPGFPGGTVVPPKPVEVVRPMVPL